MNALIYCVDVRSNANVSAELSNVLNASTELLGKIDESLIDDAPFDWLRRMALNQFKSRVNNMFNQLFRYYIIFSDTTIAKHIELKIGIPYYDFVICSFWIYSKFAKESLKGCIGPESYFLGRQEGIFRTDNILKTLQILSMPYLDIKEKLKSQVVYNEDAFIFYNQQHIKTPIWRYNGYLICPYKDVLLRQITGGMYYYAEIYEPEYDLNDVFGRGFEKYIGLILSKLNAPKKVNVIPEISYSAGKGKGHNRTSDWLIIDDSCIVFIECKTRRQSVSFKKHSTSKEYEEKTLDGVAKAVVQIYKTYNDYTNNLLADLPFDESKHFIPMVVFLEDGQYMDVSETIKDLVKEKLVESGLDATVVDDYPFHLYSADQFEFDVQLMFHFGFDTYFSKRHGGELPAELIQNFPYVQYFDEDFTKEFIEPNQ